MEMMDLMMYLMCEFCAILALVLFLFISQLFLKKRVGTHFEEGEPMQSPNVFSTPLRRPQTQPLPHALDEVNLHTTTTLNKSGDAAATPSSVFHSIAFPSSPQAPVPTPSPPRMGEGRDPLAFSGRTPSGEHLCMWESPTSTASSSVMSAASPSRNVNPRRRQMLLSSASVVAVKKAERHERFAIESGGLGALMDMVNTVSPQMKVMWFEAKMRHSVEEEQFYELADVRGKMARSRRAVHEIQRRRLASAAVAAAEEKKRVVAALEAEWARQKSEVERLLTDDLHFVESSPTTPQSPQSPWVSTERSEKYINQSAMEEALMQLDKRQQKEEEQGKRGVGSEVIRMDAGEAEEREARSLSPPLSEAPTAPPFSPSQIRRKNRHSKKGNAKEEEVIVEEEEEMSMGTPNSDSTPIMWHPKSDVLATVGSFRGSVHADSRDKKVFESLSVRLINPRLARSHEKETSRIPQQGCETEKGQDVPVHRASVGWRANSGGSSSASGVCGCSGCSSMTTTASTATSNNANTKHVLLSHDDAVEITTEEEGEQEPEEGRAGPSKGEIAANDISAQQRAGLLVKLMKQFDRVRSAPNDINKVSRTNKRSTAHDSGPCLVSSSLMLAVEEDDLPLPLPAHEAPVKNK